MALKYKMHNAPTSHTLEQGGRLEANGAIVYSIGPCSHLRFERDPTGKRVMDEFPQYFDDYPKVSELRRSADAIWIEPLRRYVHAQCDRAVSLGIEPALHLYEPMVPLAFEQEYPDLVGVWKRPTQGGTIDVHTLVDPDNPATWELFKAKYRELAKNFPQVGMFIITTGDTASAFWCVPKAKMPIHERLANLVKAARDGVREAGSHATVCFRLWWRNYPDEIYRDSHRLIAELTGVENADELMNPIIRPYNDPAEVLPKLFKALPDDVPIMYKSTRMDYYCNTPLSLALGKYPKDLEQILEISYERSDLELWPLCRVEHIRKGLDAVHEHGLAGYIAMPIAMGNNRRGANPEEGNLGRMNTWIFEQLAKADKRSDRELVAAWLEKEFGAPQPDVVIDVLLDTHVLVDEGIQWGRGINHRVPFSSLHTTKLYWMNDGFIQPDFPYKIADPDQEFIESLIQMKHDAYVRACAAIESLCAARAGIAPELFDEIHKGYQTLADTILLRRDWASYILMQYGIEKGVYPPERKVMGRMSRYVETFIRNLVRLKDTDAGKKTIQQIGFPDSFPLT